MAAHAEARLADLTRRPAGLSLFTSCVFVLFTAASRMPAYATDQVDRFHRTMDALDVAFCAGPGRDHPVARAPRLGAPLVAPVGGWRARHAEACRRAGSCGAGL